MRLTFLCTSDLDYPSPRGRWLPLAHALAAQGHEVSLVMLHHDYRHQTTRQYQPQASDPSAGRVVVYYAGQMHVYGPVGQRRYPRSTELLRLALMGAVSLARVAVQTRCDALHICKPQPINGMAGVFAARMIGCPFYVDCDDYEAGGNRFGAGWQRQMVQYTEDHLPRHAAGVTVNTRFLQQRYERQGIAPSHLVYVPNGVPAARLNPPDPRHVDGLRSALRLDSLPDAPVVMYVGTLSQTTHHVGLLLDSFALVVRRIPSARLVLVGDGEDRQQLQQQAARLGLGQQTLFVGSVPYQSVPVFLSLATCLVDPVNDDDVARARSPLKIVESLAAGVPVVTGNVGDRAEMLEGGKAGVLTAPGDSRALAEGIVRVLEDEPTRRRMATGAYQRAASYGWSRLAREWMSVYQ